MGPRFFKKVFTTIYNYFSSGVLKVANGGSGVAVSTGTGSIVLNTSPTLVTPILGQPTSGDLTNTTIDGTNNLKTYVDSLVGIETKAARLATIAVLSGSPAYVNGVAGIGATLISTVFGALSVDGTVVAVGDRILVKNEATAATNGIYTVTATGSGAAFYTLTRALDNNDSAEMGSFMVSITAGGTLLGTQWINTSVQPVTMGSTNVSFAQFTANVGSGAITGTLTVANGGTGITSFAANVATFLGTSTSANLAAALTDEEGTGAVSFCTAVALTSVPTDTGGWNEFKVSGSDVTTTGQSLVNVTGLVTGVISTASRYEFHAVLYVTTSADAGGTKYGVNVSQAPTNIVANFTGPTTVAANVQTMQASGTNANNIASALFLTTASEDGCIVIDGFFTTGAGASPVFSIQHLKGTSGTSTVKIGSVLRIKKL